MVPSRPNFEPFNLLSIGDCREMCFIIGCICSLYRIYIRDNLLLYQEIWVKYWVSKFKEGELKSEIAAMYLRFPFPHPLEIQSPVYPEVICSNAKPIYIYSSRDAVLSYVQSGDVCRFGKTNVLACTLAPYQSEVSIKTVRHLFKCLRRENCFGDDSGEGDLSHFVAILPTTSFRDGPRFHLGGQTVQFFGEREVWSSATTFLRLAKRYSLESWPTDCHATGIARGRIPVWNVVRLLHGEAKFQ